MITEKGVIREKPAKSRVDRKKMKLDSVNSPAMVTDRDHLDKAGTAVINAATDKKGNILIPKARRF